MIVCATLIAGWLTYIIVIGYTDWTLSPLLIKMIGDHCNGWMDVVPCYNDIGIVIYICLWDGFMET